MDMGSERLVVESGEETEEKKKDSVVEEMGNSGKSTFHYNGSCAAINDDSYSLPSDVKGKETEGLGSVSMPHSVVKSEASPSPFKTGKGHGLKKWRRIKREIGKGTDNSVDTGNMVIQEPSESSINPSKRPQIYAERQQRSEGSVSSTNPLVGSLDAFAPLADSGIGGPSLDTGTDSENSEDQSSKSSTAGTLPKSKNEIPVVFGFSHDKSKMRSLSGKNLIHSMHRGQQVKVRVEATKKARGEQAKMEKENSHSSVESDSRSLNFVFTQGAYATSNGIQSGRHVHYDGENVDDVNYSKEVIVGLQGGNSRDGKVRFEDISPEDLSSDSYSRDKRERGENHGSPSNQDPLVESISALQSAQEALEKEVLKFKAIGCRSPLSESVSNCPMVFSNAERSVIETISEHFPSGEGVGKFDWMDVGRELEDLFKRKIEAEVEYLIISKTMQKQRVIISNMEARRAQQNQIGDIENKAAMLKKEAEKLENFCQDIAKTDERLMLKKRVRRYTWYFLVQLLLLLVIIGFCMFQLSPNYVEVAPT